MNQECRFSELLRDMLAADGGTKASFGMQVGLSPSSMSRMLHSDETPGVQTCLRIAAYTHRSALVVLRAAGHDECADLLSSLYGTPVITQRPHDALTPSEERFTRDYLRKLSKQDLRAIKILVTRIVREAAAARTRVART